MSDKITIGAQVSCYFNGQRIGQVTALKFSSNTAYKEQFALDSLDAYEFTPTVCKIAGNVSLIRMVGDGGLEGQGITTRFESLPRLKYFTLTLRDNFTDQILFQSSQTVVTDQSWDIPAKGIVTGTFQFQGISWENEVQSGG